MIVERLVSFDTAKKLKNLGFMELCDNCNKSLDENIITFDLRGFHNGLKDTIVRPTQTHMQRWLFKRGYFVSTSFAFKEFDKEAEDAGSAKLLHFLIPEIYFMNEVHPYLYDRSFIHDKMYTQLKSNEDVLEDAINIVLDILIQKK